MADVNSDKSNELSNHVHKLKQLANEAVDKYLKTANVNEEDTSFVVVHALAMVSALHVQMNDESEAAFLTACKNEWDWVKNIFDLKKAYDSMTPEERKAVIEGKLIPKV